MLCWSLGCEAEQLVLRASLTLALPRGERGGLVGCASLMGLPVLGSFS